MNKISLILPVYNVKDYIITCLESIKNQTYRDFELLVVDDCGSDESMLLATTYLSTSQLNYKIIKHQKNLGLSEARNTGIKNAIAPYLFFLDSDDTLRADALEILASTIIDTGADIVSFRGIEFLAAEERYRPLSCPPSGLYTAAEYLQEVLTGRSTCHIGFRLFNRCLFARIQFPSRVLYEDTLTFPYLVSESKSIAQIEEGLYFYLIRAGSITGSKPKYVDLLIKRMEELRQFLVDEQQMPKKLVDRFSSNLYLIVASCIAIFSTNLKADRSIIKDVLNHVNTITFLQGNMNSRFVDAVKLMILKVRPSLLNYIYRNYRKAS